MSEKDAEGFSSNVLELIQKQQAEIERLTNYNRCIDAQCRDLLDNEEKARAEAIKVFAEKLKKHKCSYDIDNYHYFEAIDVDDIDEVIKEMIGEQE